jgi:hypothetical protein
VPDEFRHGPRTQTTKTRVTRADWLALGRDRNSIFDTKPDFANPPQYEDFKENRWGFRIPSTAAEARSWFTLKDRSSGTRGASDRRDIGISLAPMSVVLPLAGASPSAESAPSDPKLSSVLFRRRSE